MPLGASPPLFGPNSPLRESFVPQFTPSGLLSSPIRPPRASWQETFLLLNPNPSCSSAHPPHYSEPFCLLGALCVPIYPFGPPQPHLASSGLLAPGKGTFLLFRLIEPQGRSRIRSQEKIKSFQNTFSLLNLNGSGSPKVKIFI